MGRLFTLTTLKTTCHPFYILHSLWIAEAVELDCVGGG